jgi:hypothetical protein
MTATVLSVSSLLVSVLALLVSSLVAWRQLGIMRQSNLLPVTLDMFGEFRTPAFRISMRYLTERLWEDHPPADDLDMLGLPDDVREKIVPVVSYFNNVGLLVANGLIDERTVQSFMGSSVLRAWTRVSPYIRVERDKRGDPDYNGYFEHLAARCRQWPPKPLGLQRVPEDYTFDITPYVRRTARPAGK